MKRIIARAAARARLLPVCGLLAAGLVCALPLARSLNLLTLGDDAASQLGADVERDKRILLLATSLMVGAAVSVAGRTSALSCGAQPSTSVTTTNPERITPPVHWCKGRSAAPVIQDGSGCG